LKHLLARKALKLWAMENSPFLHTEAKEFLHAKSNKCYAVTKSELNNILGKSRCYEGRDVRVPHGNTTQQRKLWEYVEYE
jgi:hypothetical protein